MERDYIKSAIGAVVTGLVVGLIVGLLVLLISALLPTIELPAALCGLIAGGLTALVYYLSKLGLL